jgi:4-amino-4-deoxy-L-arabinose transferase-like glycosyltransferase
MSTFVSRIARYLAALRREPLLLLVVVAWAGIYLTRPSILPLRGEEPRRARIAQEMLDTGDYFVSRVQGVPELGRPPLAEWAIIGSWLLFGEMSPQAIRFPATASMLVAALMLYFYVRGFCSAYGAAAAALIYLSFGQMLQMGRIAESDSLYAAMAALALLGWHRGYVAGRSPWQVWAWGYGFAALAVLAKSPQAGIYFVAAVTAYLAWRRDWRFLFARGHLIGIFVGATIVGAWALPYYLTEGLDLLRQNLFRHVAGRRLNASMLVGHLLAYPWQVVGATLPWSVLLVRYADRRFWRELGSAREAVSFCGIAVVVTLPTVWWSWGTMPRHFMTMYPCLAVLASIVVNQVLVASPATSLVRGWRWFAGFSAAALLIAGLGMGFTSLVDLPVAQAVTQPAPLMIGFAVISILGATSIVWSIRSTGGEEGGSGRRRFAGFVAIAALVGSSYAGPALNMIVAVSEDHATAMRRLKQRFPADTRLVSLGLVDAVFSFHYRDPIRVVPWPKTDDDLPAVGDYFAFDTVLTEGREPSFAWERIAVFACDRNHHEASQRPVVIGRRIAEPATQAAAATSLRR